MKPESTSPNPHFSKTQPEAYICCLSCKEPLWEMVVRTSAGAIVSTSMKPVGKNKEKFQENKPECPLCGQKFYKSKGKDKQILIRSTWTGEEFLL